MAELKDRLGMAVMLITHAMGVVAETAQRVVVMYAGQVMKEAPLGELFAHPRPLRAGLMQHSAHRYRRHAQGAAGGHSRQRAQADQPGAGMPLCVALQTRHAGLRHRHATAA